jgi:NADH:ubiquinone oxidoreductase subunit F (NADH-binding)
VSATQSPDMQTQAASPEAQLPRLLAAMPADGWMSLAAHSALHGPAPATRTRRRAHSDLIDLIERSGLRGRGGAGFPTATKMRAVASSRGRPVVVINAAEGEPASRKDRTLTAALPHLVLDGGQLAAQALGAHEVIVGVCQSAQTSSQSLAAAIAERGPTKPAIRLVSVPDHYVAGQETALIAHLNGAPALPTFTPPMAYQHGVGRRPTLLSNSETFAHVALIARHGADWFRQLGTTAQPGSALVTLSGPVAHPGVFEIEYGVPLSALLDAAGGLSASPRGLLLGGYGGSWVGPHDLPGLTLAEEHLEDLGASLGAGVVALLSEHACPIAETSRIVRWLAEQSAGQCGPCVHGLDALATGLQEIIGESQHPPTRERITQLTTLVNRRGACAHPDGAARLVQSAMRAFDVEFAEHERYGPCELCRNPAELPLPSDRRLTVAR